MLTLHGRTIKRALIVDDEEEARKSYEYLIEDMNLRSLKVAGPLFELHHFIASIESTDVIVCDYHLKKHSYAPCDGDRLLAECYQAGIPGVLCTAIAETPIRREYIKYIPAIIRSSEPEPDELCRAWKRCILELDNVVEPARRGWRTLVRVAEVDLRRRWFYVIVPAFSVRTKVPIDIDSVPPEIKKRIEEGALDLRFHAVVNTGAETSGELFFDKWEAE